MKNGWIRRSLLALVPALALVVAVPSQAADEFLDVDAAFKLSTAASPDGTVAVKFEIAPGYYLYQERISFAVGAEPEPEQALDVAMPQAQVKHDPNFDRDMQIYHDALALRLMLDKVPATRPTVLHVRYQGCAEAGLCYPPQAREFGLRFSPAGTLSAVESSAVPVVEPLAPSPAVVTAVSVPTPAAVPAASGSRIESALQSGRLLTICGVFLLAGLLLSFTPCVLPMVPILSAIILGDSGAKTGGRLRGFGLAASYSLGMALVYTAFGVVAGLLGEGLAASLQNPWVLGGFAALMVGLALSMFDVYNLQMPSFLQTRLTQVSGRFQGGNHVGVFLMGGVSALVVGPCVAAPLAGALVYISQTKNVMIGGAALFSLACGMSVPLLLVGLSAGTLLPKAGRWMQSVKTVMGMMMLALAWWLVSPVLPESVSMLIIAAWLAFAAVLLGTLNTAKDGAGMASAFSRSLGLVLLCVSVAQVAGALAGATSPWQPLAPLAQRGGAAPLESAAATAQFRRVDSAEALDVALAAAAGRPVMVDFYADWCVACKELEHSTFADPLVREHMADMVLLQADVTRNDESQRAMLKRYGLFGPPGVLFFDAQGREISSRRVVGFQGPEEFLASFQAASSCMAVASAVAAPTPASC